MKTITIRIDNELEELLESSSIANKVSKSEIVRQALSKHLAVQKFRELRRKALPIAEAQGILTDEDVYNLIS